MLLLAPPSFDGVGSLTTPTPTIELGEVKSGPEIVRVFELKNRGTGTIRILKTTPGCGCVRAELKQQVLKPGETTTLNFTANSLTQPEGPVTWRITVEYQHETNDKVASTATLELKLTGRLVREITVAPPAIAASITAEMKQTIVITDRREKAALVKAARTTHRGIMAEVRERDTAAKTQSIDIFVSGELPVGTHDEVVVITTSDPGYSELRVPLRIQKRVPGGAAVNPERLVIRIPKGQESASMAAQVRAGGRPVSILRVECDQPGVTARWSEGNGPVATVRVVVDTAKAGTSGQTELRIPLADPPSTILLPLRWEAAENSPAHHEK